jgi:hypothetical protein
MHPLTPGYSLSGQVLIYKSGYENAIDPRFQARL